MTILQNDIVWITYYTIHKMNKYKNAGDMLMLYFAYMEQGRIQGTNQTRSTDIFMQKKLWWWKDRFWSSKRWLKQLWLIEVVVKKDAMWVVLKHYVKTNFMINSGEIPVDTTRTLDSQTVGCPDGGKQETNAWSIKDKCLKDININTIEIEFEEFWNSYNKKVWDKKKCLKTYSKLTKEEKEKIKITLPSFLMNIKDKQYQPHPSTYLNQKRWNDEIPLIWQDYENIYEFDKAMKTDEVDKIKDFFIRKYWNTKTREDRHLRQDKYWETKEKRRQDPLYLK